MLCCAGDGDATTSSMLDEDFANFLPASSSTPHRLTSTSKKRRSYGDVDDDDEEEEDDLPSSTSSRLHSFTDCDTLSGSEGGRE